MRKLRLFLRGRLFPVLLCLFTAVAIFFALAVWLPCALAPIAFAERLFSLAAALYVATERSPAENKISRMVLLFLPWVGAIFCLLTRSKAQEETFCPHPAEGGIGGARAISETLCGLKACTAKSLTYFPDGRSACTRLLEDVARAKKSVYLEFYIVAEGMLWGELLSLLETKAKEGADVRLIYDGFGCALTLPKDYPSRLAEHGIRCAVFPFRPSLKSERRDHRKIAVIDGKIAYTGGFNLADEYIGEKIRFGHWKDAAIRMTGSAAARFSELFARSWNALSRETLSPSLEEGGSLPCCALSDDATPREVRTGETILFHLIRNERRFLFLTTPYLALPAPLKEALCAAALAGVDVRLLIPKTPDKRLPYLLTLSYARELERRGVQVKRYDPGFLHAKCVMGSELCLVSSYNLDFRSLRLQAECGLCFRDKKTADVMKRDFFAAWEGASPLPPASRSQRACATVLRLISPII